MRPPRSVPVAARQGGSCSAPAGQDRRKSLGWAAVVAAMLSLASMCAGAGQPDPALADQGKRVYTSLCARCHGLNLVSNGIGFDLRQFPQGAEERFRTSVTKGLRAMPAWEGVLKPGELEALWAYVGSVNGW